jgi:hypothetical protein
MRFNVGDIVCLTTNNVLGMITYIGEVVTIQWSEGGKAYWYHTDADIYLVLVQPAECKPAGDEIR